MSTTDAFTPHEIAVSALAAAERQLDEMGRSLAADLAQRVLGRPLNGASN